MPFPTHKLASEWQNILSYLKNYSNKHCHRNCNAWGSHNLMQFSVKLKIVCQRLGSDRGMLSKSRLFVCPFALNEEILNYIEL